MATKNCVKVLRGTVARVTRLDSCGRPLLGTGSTVVTGGIVEIKVSAEVESGDEIKVKAFDGSLCISDKYCDTVKWWNTDVTMCSVDPDIVALMNPTYTPIIGADGTNIGFMDSTTLDCSAGFALEVWMQAIGTVTACSQPAYTGVRGQWWYYCLPWVIGGTPGDIDLKNDAVSFEYKGRTKPQSQWGVGPYPVLITAPGTSGSPTPVCGPLPLAVTPNAQVVQLLTTLGPPAAQCGAQDTVIPTAMTATLPSGSGTGSLTFTGGTVANAVSSLAVINWGDGTSPVSFTLTTTGTPTCNPMGPLPVYNGTIPDHVYACPGNYQVTVTSGGQTIPLTAVAGGTMTGTASAGSGGLSKTVTLNTLTNIKQTALTIDWGDGTVPFQAVTAVPATGSPFCLVLPTPLPTHVYATAATFTIKVHAGTEVSSSISVTTT